MKTPILGSSYVARSVNAADSRMINLFPEVLNEGKEAAFLQRAPGLRLVVTVGDGPIRGMWKFGDFLYVVSGGNLFRVDTNYQVTNLGLVNGSGPVSMTDNGEQLFIACNPDAFIYNASTGVFGRITDPDFPGAVTVGYLDGYFVFNQPNSQRFWVTLLNDGTQIDPLDFASAEGNPDNIVSLIVDHREVWLFGNNTTEVWYNAGLPDFPLARIQGAFMEIGCLAPYSVAKLDNSVFWLGADVLHEGLVLLLLNVLDGVLLDDLRDRHAVGTKFLLRLLELVRRNRAHADLVTLAFDVGLLGLATEVHAHSE